ncbi:hypothetical protein ACOMHN_061904 [Nucella lapillus]
MTVEIVNCTDRDKEEDISESNQCLSLDRCSDRSTSPVKAEEEEVAPASAPARPRSSPSAPGARERRANMKMSMNDNSGLHPIFGDKVHPSSLKRNHYTNQPGSSLLTKNGSSLLDSSRSLPHSSRSGPRSISLRASPCPAARPLPMNTCCRTGPATTPVSPGGIDDGDGNTTTSGSYTLDMMDVDDSLS